MIEFKDLEVSEIGAVVKMMEDFYAIDNYAFNAEVSTENFQKFIQNPEVGQVFLIKEGEAILGYIIIVYFFSFEFQGKVALLDELFIVSEARGKGLGKRGVRFAEKFAESKQCKLLLLEVEPHNTRAQTLYSGEGFVHHPRQFMRKKISMD